MPDNVNFLYRLNGRQVLKVGLEGGSGLKHLERPSNVIPDGTYQTQSDLAKLTQRRL